MSPFHDSAVLVSLTDFEAPRASSKEEERKTLESDPWESRGNSTRGQDAEYDRSLYFRRTLEALVWIWFFCLARGSISNKVQTTENMRRQSIVRVYGRVSAISFRRLNMCAHVWYDIPSERLEAAHDYDAERRRSESAKRDRRYSSIRRLPRALAAGTLFAGRSKQELSYKKWDCIGCARSSACRNLYVMRRRRSETNAAVGGDGFPLPFSFGISSSPRRSMCVPSS